MQNWACNAHTTADMLDRVDRAIAAGHVNNSSTVVLAAGMNDFHRGVSAATVTANLVSAVNKVRRAAPVADVIILGRLATTATNGANCTTNLIPNIPMVDVDPHMVNAENATQSRQSAAARQTGATFIDIRSMTRAKNNTCAKDTNRYVSGLRDVTSTKSNMNSHPTVAGNRFLASQVRQKLG